MLVFFLSFFILLNRRNLFCQFRLFSLCNSLRFGSNRMQVSINPSFLLLISFFFVPSFSINNLFQKKKKKIKTNSGWSIPCGQNNTITMEISKPSQGTDELVPAETEPFSGIISSNYLNYYHYFILISILFIFPTFPPPSLQRHLRKHNLHHFSL